MTENRIWTDFILVRTLGSDLISDQRQGFVADATYVISLDRVIATHALGGIAPLIIFTAYLVVAATLVDKKGMGQ